MKKIGEGPDVEKGLIEERVKWLVKEAQPLRRRLQDYRGELINAVPIEEIHNKITVLVGALENWREHDEVKHQQAEELRVILRDAKIWLAEKNNELLKK
ncbi:hypothetical protein COU49_01630 [Candidatus Nomurabacteria bacterium CG10_big_fil_rev_8_21_14_0_10_35_16]|uniref:Uncharacterized protein n=1 Tax=Candidatus Nomurabacteria bacterium CG10_big_fil_rev_8_21_14_0_10_35_16 TaxID=1974731 RepID=A0A2H0TBE9_9BACT|nr:MAG: hypothetical protein COU49_01630 [Candidatus Nomurabacteria bacterium CG10_big_fil_rev_8_21_14_0_10_35_16]